MNNHLLEIRGLDYQIGNKKILTNLNLDLSKGKFQIILGANGVGKSTFLKILAGLLSCSTGKVIADKDLLTSYLGHDSQLYLDLTVRQNLEFIRGFFSIPSEVDDLLRRWDLLVQADLTIEKLSQGQAKRLSLAIHFAMPANLFLLDEPSSNLDHLGKDLLMKELFQLKQRKQASVLLITHELSDYFEFADRIYYLGSSGLDLIYDKSDLGFSLSAINQRYLELLKS